ncbi:MAG: hypothetical protein AB1603_00855 [Chloroflexota bacterium]
MEWQWIVALVLALPVLLVGAALVWYIQVSGIYQVIRATRERQKVRARALKEATEPITGGK